MAVQKVNNKNNIPLRVPIYFGFLSGWETNNLLYLARHSFPNQGGSYNYVANIKDYSNWEKNQQPPQCNTFHKTTTVQLHHCTGYRPKIQVAISLSDSPLGDSQLGYPMNEWMRFIQRHYTPISCQGLFLSVGVTYVTVHNMGKDVSTKVLSRKRQRRPAWMQVELDSNFSPRGNLLNSLVM